MNTVIPPPPPTPAPTPGSWRSCRAGNRTYYGQSSNALLEIDEILANSDDHPRPPPVRPHRPLSIASNTSRRAPAAPPPEPPASRQQQQPNRQLQPQQRHASRLDPPKPPAEEAPKQRKELSRRNSSPRGVGAESPERRLSVPEVTYHPLSLLREEVGRANVSTQFTAPDDGETENETTRPSLQVRLQHSRKHLRKSEVHDIVHDYEIVTPIRTAKHESGVISEFVLPLSPTKPECAPHGQNARSSDQSPTRPEHATIVDSTRADKTSRPTNEDNEEHPFFVGSRDVRDLSTLKEKKIYSTKGTVRGFKNRVRAGIANLSDNSTAKAFREKEKFRLVVYTTSMRIVRKTYEDCVRVRQILQNHLVSFEERDIFMSERNQRQLCLRLALDRVDVPKLYADGVLIGGREEIELLNETGELKKIFKHFERVERLSSCAMCGGHSYHPCLACHGSRKSVHRNHFRSEFMVLKCTACDENGLVRCERCKRQ